VKKTFASQESRLFSRELSWLAFNDRVLEEAADPSNPLLERFRFLIIVSTNLEEFFMVRVAELFRLRSRGVRSRDSFSMEDLFVRIRRWVFDQKNRQAQLFEELCGLLKEQGLAIEPVGPSPKAEELFVSKVLPELVPRRVLDHERLPHVKGGRMNLLARHSRSYSWIEIPERLPRFFISEKSVFLVERLVSTYKQLLFKTDVHEIISFKISRDAEIELDENSEDLLKDVEEGVQERDQGDVVRLEVDGYALSETVDWLGSQLGVGNDVVYRFNLPLDLRSFMPIYNMTGFQKLKFRYPRPHRPTSLPESVVDPESCDRFFSTLQSEDILLHHPYSSFDPVVELVQCAAADPKVFRIGQTLYRTSGESPILEALVAAARAGKHVTALVEIKARFDEANNIRWARRLEAAGARVIYSTPRIKVHAKLTYVGRKVGADEQGFVHVSTGNYHPRTAKFYTDLGLLSSRPEYVSEARSLFDRMELMDQEDDFSDLNDPTGFASRFQHFAVAPGLLHETILEQIEREKFHAAQGRPAWIRAKMNGLVEASTIEALYEASGVGVKIELLVRGVCCLRPGVPGLSENIEVRSIVDKYLEHSRVFLFGGGGNPRAWLSSADWMPRNFFKRIELAVPVLNQEIVSYLLDQYWKIHWGDNVKARRCNSNGVYERLLPLGEKNLRAQSEFELQLIPRFLRHPSGGASS
jgi:polyphosphate kinase